jgi:hypothetical protein
MLRTLNYYLAGDERLTPTEECGVWALTAWPDSDPQNIAVMAQKAMYLKRGPMTEHELWQTMRKVRPITVDEMTDGLGSGLLFKPVGPDGYTLVFWDDVRSMAFSPTPQSPSPLRAAVLEVFARNRTRQMPLAELAKGVAALTGRKVEAVRNFIGWSKALVREPSPDNPARTIVTLAHPRILRYDPPTLRSKFEAIVRELLEAAPERTMPFVELKEQTLQRIKMSGDTFDNYLRHLRTVSKYPDSEAGKTLCTLLDKPAE